MVLKNASQGVSNAAVAGEGGEGELITMDISNVANLANPEAAILESKNIAVEGLDDEAFARKIEEALRAQPGVKEVRLDKDGGILSITFDTRQTNFPDLHDLILKSGYRPSRSIDE
jgi:hypothetical protein